MIGDSIKFVVAIPIAIILLIFCLVVTIIGAIWKSISVFFKCEIWRDYIELIGKFKEEFEREFDRLRN